MTQAGAAGGSGRGAASRRAALVLGLALVSSGCGAAPPRPAAEVVEVAAPAPASTASPAPSRDLPARVAGPVTQPERRVVRGEGYRYEVPADWEELDASALGSPLIAHAQRSLDHAGGFAQNVNVAVEPFVGDGPAYGSANLAELKQVSTIRRDGPVSVGARQGWDIEASWPNPGAVPYVTLQRYATNGTEGFVLTCSTGESGFAQRRATCDAILATFTVD